MALNMNRGWGYAYSRPQTPNTTTAPAGLAPGATVTVFASGTTNPVLLYADQFGLTPLANPLTADINGFFNFYCLRQHVDVQFSGTGITSPYTLGDYIFVDQSPIVFNVSDFGALGNGINDDTLAIQAAINAAGVAGGGIVWLPVTSAAYVITSPLTIASPGVSLVGADRAATITVQSGTAHGIIVAASYVNLLDFTLTSGVPNRTGDGIHIQGPTRWAYIHHERVNTSFHFNGFYSAGTAITWRQCITGPNTGNGFLLDGTTNPLQGQSQMDLDYCQANGCALSGFLVQGGGEDIRMNYCFADANGVYGFWFNQPVNGNVISLDDIYLLHCKASGNAGGFIFTDVQKLLMTNPFVEASLVSPNISLTGVLAATIIGGYNQLALATGGGGIGLAITQSTLIAVTGMVFNTNVKSDIDIASNATQVTITGCVCQGSPYCVAFDTGQTGPIAIVGGNFTATTAVLVGMPFPGSRFMGVVGLSDLPTPAQAAVAYNTNPATAGVILPASALVGGSSGVTLNMTGALVASALLVLPTVAALIAALTVPGYDPTIGQSYTLRIINSSSVNFPWTVTTNTGWTLLGTMSIPQATTREFYLTITSLTTATLQSVGITGYS
jgi:hypothetical protein